MRKQVDEAQKYIEDCGYRFESCNSAYLRTKNGKERLGERRAILLGQASHLDCRRGDQRAFGRPEAQTVSDSIRKIAF
jgi:hypothetical protein